jgi:dTDP-L-rhamnose 4-epimerase
LERALITGGAGFIGSHLADGLLDAGYSVRVLDVLDPQVHRSNGRPDYLDPDVEVIQGDVLDQDALGRALRHVDVVFHFAAAVGVGQSMYEVPKYVGANCLGTATLLDALISEPNAVRKLVVASSMSIYGEGRYRCDSCGHIAPRPRPLGQLRSRRWEVRCPDCHRDASPAPTDESKPLQPTSVYAVTKRDQEELCLSIGRAYGLPTVALRFFNVYGPRQSLANPYTGVAAIFLSRLMNGKPPLIFEDGRQGRDFIHVRDIVQANLLALESDEADYLALNVGTGRLTSVRRIAGVLGEVLGVDTPPEVVHKFREGDIRHCYADISRIQRALGYRPKVSLEEGMADLARWTADQQATDLVDRATEELAVKGLVK